MELRGAFYYVYQFTTEDTIKHTDEHPDGKVHRVRSGRVASIGTLVSVELGYTNLPAPMWKHFRSIPFSLLLPRGWWVGLKGPTL